MEYNEKCPICGAMNKGLNLDETNGWFECEKCGSVVNTLRVSVPFAQIPLYKLSESSGKQAN